MWETVEKNSLVKLLEQAEACSLEDILTPDELLDIRSYSPALLRTIRNRCFFSGMGYKMTLQRLFCGFDLHDWIKNIGYNL